MVFDNCQIDVFFHMRSHYSRLRNVHSVVDCSAPKGLRRMTQSSTSLQHAGMAPFCNSSSGSRSHNCCYTNCVPAINPCSMRCSSRAKSLPPRPGTRRHPDDMPFTNTTSRSARNSARINQGNTKTSPIWTGRPNHTPRYRSKNKPQQQSNAVMSNGYPDSKNSNSGYAKLETFHSRSYQDVRPKTEAMRSPLSHKTYITPVNQKSIPSSEYGEPKESPKYNTPTGTPTYKPAPVSPRNHEYLQFLLKITEDIIRNDLYTNKEMKKVFVSHFNANKDRLDSDRMILQIHQLMKELNIPLSDDEEEDDTPSWCEIEKALRGLGIEEIKPNEDIGRKKTPDSKYKSCPGLKEKCICFDLRNLDQNLTVKRKIPEKEVDINKYDDCSSKNQFQTSLDRLTEHTEPIASQATCKASTVTSSSTFGNVDVLPGFEGLDTPKTAKSSTCEKASMSQCPGKPYRKGNCRGPRVRKKSKPRKRRRRSRRTRIRRPKSIIKGSTCTKCIENVCQASIVAQTRGTDPSTEALTEEIFPKKENQKPLIITLQQGNENQTSIDNLSVKPFKNDYLLIRGPIYLLKTFLDENPNLVVRIEVPSVNTTAVNSKLGNGDSSKDDRNTVNPSNKTEYRDSLVNDILVPKVSSKEVEVASTSEKYKEVRNILMQITSNLSSDTSHHSNGSNESVFLNEKLTSAISTQTDTTDASKFGMSSASQIPHLSSNIPCSNPSTCSKLCSALASRPSVTASEDNLLMTNDYDLTPQRDKKVSDNLEMDQLVGEEYGVHSILHDFFMAREMQTEELHIEPTIVAFARIEKDKLPNNEQMKEIYSSTSSNEEVSNILTSLGVNPGKSMNPNESLPNKQNQQEKSGMKTIQKPLVGTAPDTDAGKSVTMRESVFASYPTTSTAPVERKYEMPDEVGQEFQIKLMFPFLQSPKLPIESARADSDEAIAHTRRVSIMRNPIIQLPGAKIPTEVDDSKKKGESIMKAVDVFKERQAPKDTYLTKAMQGIENKRESRMVEKMLQESKWTQDRPSSKAVSALPDVDTSSIDEVYAIGTTGSSYVELPIKTSSQKQEGNVGGPVDEHSIEKTVEIKPSPSQTKRITLVSEKLDNLRTSDPDDDYEFSATLDQLVLSLKQEQETEEDIQIIDEDTPTQQSDTSVGKKFFRCCNFGKKKAPLPSRNIQEPPQRDSFSEKQYRSKSEAFEMALIALGQAPTQDSETSRPGKEKHQPGDLMEVASAQSIVLALGGTKLPPLNVAPSTEKNTNTIDIDFDKISTMAMHSTDDDKSARFKF